MNRVAAIVNSTGVPFQELLRARAVPARNQVIRGNGYRSGVAPDPRMLDPMPSLFEPLQRPQAARIVSASPRAASADVRSVSSLPSPVKAVVRPRLAPELVMPAAGTKP